jgi:hypothetical protein
VRQADRTRASTLIPWRGRQKAFHQFIHRHPDLWREISGILEIVPASDGSAYSEYVLTEKGRGLFPVIVALRQWGEEFFFDSAETHVRLVDRADRQPVRKLELHAHDGRLLKAEDTIVA